MRVVLFVHSLVSDWNHGNAHFLRGVVRELLARGHDVKVFEPRDGWSRTNLVREQGEDAVREFERAFPALRSETYELDTFDLCAVTAGADLVLVHEWNEPELVRRVGEARRRAQFRLLFHDTHHRAATAPHELARFELGAYDGVLAFGRAITELYEERGWRDRAWSWHEAADTRLFRPLDAEVERDLVWIGNWGDDERAAELREFLIEPVRELGLTATVYGVRYPEGAVRELRAAGIEYRGWLPNHRVPEVFARHRVTVHVPRRPYARALPGIPTIRVFEALACGIPLVSAPWDDVDGLFRAHDFRRARDGGEMVRELRAALADDRGRGLETIRERHTCAHRVDELLALVEALEDEQAAA